MRQAQEARLRVRVVAELTAEAHRIMVRRRPAACPDRVVLPQGPVALVERLVKRRRARRIISRRLPLHHRALRVKGVVEHHAPIVPRPPAVRRFAVHRRERRRAAAVGFFHDGACAVVEEVGGDGRRAADRGGGLSDAEAVAVIGGAEGRAADARQAVFGVKVILMRDYVLNFAFGQTFPKKRKQYEEGSGIKQNELKTTPKPSEHVITGPRNAVCVWRKMCIKPTKCSTPDENRQTQHQNAYTSDFSYFHGFLGWWGLYQYS